jgi:murein DD-endopeptidase MepM/ murein hydrolase activator NlpD
MALLKPFEPYKIDQKFGNPTSYGPHEGWDMNGLGGGNTDCNTPLRAVAEGEVVHSSESTKDYGKLAVLLVKTTKGNRWVRYCHCNELRVRSGSVRSGDIVATMGSTGNSTACHLHFDVFKKFPPHWRYFAKTAETHDEYFEDPTLFFSYDTIGPEMPNYIAPVLKDNLKIDVAAQEGVFRSQVGTVKDSVSNYDSTKNQLTQLQDDYAEVQGLLKEKEEKLSTAENEIFELTKKMEDGQKALAERDVLISDLNKEIVELQQKQKFKVLLNLGGLYICSLNEGA